MRIKIIMRVISLLIVMMGLMAHTSFAQKMTFPADSVAPDGNSSYHGLRITDQDAISVPELTEKLAAEGDQTSIKVAGEIDAVCQMKGCWMTLNLPDGETMRVTFKDYGFFVPTDAPGKTAVVEGRAYLDTTSVADLRHFAEDGGMSADEAAAKYTEPKVEYAFKATGVMIKE